jgi:hypothetical protein
VAKGSPKAGLRQSCVDCGGRRRWSARRRMSLGCLAGGGAVGLAGRVICKPNAAMLLAAFRHSPYYFAASGSLISAL